MTPAERKILEGKRAQLEAERAEAQVKIHQATGAIAMLDAVLRFPAEVPADQIQADDSQAA